MRGIRAGYNVNKESYNPQCNLPRTIRPAPCFFLPARTKIGGLSISDTKSGLSAGCLELGRMVVCDICLQAGHFESIGLAVPFLINFDDSVPLRQACCMNFLAELIAAVVVQF